MNPGNQVRFNPYEAPALLTEVTEVDEARGAVQLLCAALCILFSAGLPILLAFRFYGILNPFAWYSRAIELLIGFLFFFFPAASIATGWLSGYHKKSTLVSFATALSSLQLVLSLLILYAVFLSYQCRS